MLNGAALDIPQGYHDNYAVTIVRKLDPWMSRALLTMCKTVGMSVNVSVRLDDSLAERLRLRAHAAGESVSERLRRYADEGAVGTSIR